MPVITLIIENEIPKFCPIQVRLIPNASIKRIQMLRITCKRPRSRLQFVLRPSKVSIETANERLNNVVTSHTTEQRKTTTELRTLALAYTPFEPVPLRHHPVLHFLVLFLVTLTSLKSRREVIE